MRERINRLAKGILDFEVPKITVKPLEITDTIGAGESFRGEIHVRSENKIQIKGLVYSSNYRVTMQNHAFGGTNNQLVYDVDSSYMEDGDQIKGSFSLITNGGEVEIPYSFQVELEHSGKTLSGLKTGQDFAEIAKRDADTALRLFEYRDFCEAPFMNDLKVRAYYDGLKGRPDRKNQMEEFLTGIGVKEPVELLADCQNRHYEESLQVIEDHISLLKSGWGYVRIEVSWIGDFIQVPQRVITEYDFMEDEYELQFFINPAKLHKGCNTGQIILKIYGKTFVVPIEAVNRDQEKENERLELIQRKQAYSTYLESRLLYESGLYESAPLKEAMGHQLDILERTGWNRMNLSLFRAELSLMNQETEQAELFLDDCMDPILSEREENQEIYCFYQYLRVMLSQDEKQKEALVRLIHKYMEEYPDKAGLVFLLEKLDSQLFENPGSLYLLLKKIYQTGSRSPFLYQLTCRVFNYAPEVLHMIDRFEIHTLYYGAKHHMISQEVALFVARAANGLKTYNPLYYKILILLYGEFPNKGILESICSLLIRGSQRGQAVFEWYEKGVSEGIALTRLYEYYLYSLPKNYNKPLPKEVLLYFSYDHELESYTKSVLFKNILTYIKADDPIYHEYERQIEKYAMDQLFEQNINSQLAVIYDRMIYQDMIDLPVAKVLPSILCAYCIQCSDLTMKYVVVRYLDLTDEVSFLLEDGTAYIPLYSERCILLFQDIYGNRYSTVECQKMPVMRKSSLVQKCFQVYPDHQMLRMKRCEEIMDRGLTDQSDVDMLEQSFEWLSFNSLYQKKILSKIISFYQNRICEETEEDHRSESYLLKLDKTVLTKEERNGICETLINRNYIQEAYDMIGEFGCEGLKINRILKLCNRMIVNKLFGQDSLLLFMAYEIFQSGKSDSVVIDYLCEHYNGASESMYHILMRGISAHVETYDLEERLTAQMMFSGCTGRLDKVFDLYINRKKAGETIVKSYFTIKSSQYFLEEKIPDDKVFSYLEKAVETAVDKGRVPVLYLMALSKYYSCLPSLSEEQVVLCSEMIRHLIKEQLVFPYFKILAHRIPMPEDIMDKTMIQYISAQNAKVGLQIRILPDEEEFHSEDMYRVFQGVFVKQKVLFEGEMMEYRIYEQEGGNWVLKTEGSVSCEASVRDKESRFACLNEMSLCLNIKDETGLKKHMEEYLIKNAEAEELFPFI